ncbi:MAG: hypothetical protein WA989_09385, partial [Henriciella sp.]
FDRIIFTTYRTALSDAEILAFTDAHELFALTVPVGWLLGKDSELLQSNIPVFTHTVNRADISDALKAAGVSGVYTDYLYPSQAN